MEPRFLSNPKFLLTFLDPSFFLAHIFGERAYFGPKVFWPKKMLDPIFWTHIFWTQHFLGPKLFYNVRFFIEIPNNSLLVFLYQCFLKRNIGPLMIILRNAPPSALFTVSYFFILNMKFHSKHSFQLLFL